MEVLVRCRAVGACSRDATIARAWIGDRRGGFCQVPPSASIYTNHHRARHASTSLIASPCYLSLSLSLHERIVASGITPHGLASRSSRRRNENPRLGRRCDVLSISSRLLLARLSRAPRGSTRDVPRRVRVASCTRTKTRETCEGSGRSQRPPLRRYCQKFAEQKCTASA